MLDRQSKTYYGEITPKRTTTACFIQEESPGGTLLLHDFPWMKQAVVVSFRGIL